MLLLRQCQFADMTGPGGALHFKHKDGNAIMAAMVKLLPEGFPLFLAPMAAHRQPRVMDDFAELSQATCAGRGLAHYGVSGLTQLRQLR